MALNGYITMINRGQGMKTLLYSTYTVKHGYLLVETFSLMLVLEQVSVQALVLKIDKMSWSPKYRDNAEDHAEITNKT